MEEGGKTYSMYEFKEKGFIKQQSDSANRLIEFENIWVVGIYLIIAIIQYEYGDNVLRPASK